MELKNVNSSDGNVVASNLINVNLFFLEIMKIEFKIEDHMLFFLKDAITT
jgi:hypothetical protein